jgi:hypothetical protein
LVVPTTAQHYSRHNTAALNTCTATYVTTIRYKPCNSQ